jgi:hypothetical protein
MDNIKLLLDVSLINLLPRFKTCEVFLRNPNNLRGIVFYCFFLRLFYLAVRDSDYTASNNGTTVKRNLQDMERSSSCLTFRHRASYI